jgi:hypothetical protein
MWNIFSHDHIVSTAGDALKIGNLGTSVRDLKSNDTRPSPRGRRRPRLPRHTSRAARFPGHVQRVCDCDVHPLPEVQSSRADLSTPKMLFLQSTVVQSLHKSMQKPLYPPPKNTFFCSRSCSFWSGTPSTRSSSSCLLLTHDTRTVFP